MHNYSAYACLVLVVYVLFLCGAYLRLCLCILFLPDITLFSALYAGLYSWVIVFSGELFWCEEDGSV